MWTKVATFLSTLSVLFRGQAIYTFQKMAYGSKDKEFLVGFVSIEIFI